MQGKEASEQETKVKSSVGIDVSKDRLEVHVLPSGQTLSTANTAEGIRQKAVWVLGEMERRLASAVRSSVSAGSILPSAR